MTDYRIDVSRSATKELMRLDRSIASRVIARIEGLKDEPRPPLAKKLRGGSTDILLGDK